MGASDTDHQTQKSRSYNSVRVITGIGALIITASALCLIFRVYQIQAAYTAFATLLVVNIARRYIRSRSA
jgi:hypothetical protein